VRHSPCACSTEVFAEEREDVFRFGVAPEHRLCEDQFTVEVNVEDAVRPRNDLYSVDHVLPFLENARDQTGRVGQRTSGNAVLDPDAMPHGHRGILVSPSRSPHPPNHAGLALLGEHGHRLLLVRWNDVDDKGGLRVGWSPGFRSTQRPAASFTNTPAPS
jgi:hypothetical protein